MHRLVPISPMHSLRPITASAVLLAALGCSGADDADDTTPFMSAPSAGFGALPSAPPNAAGSVTPPATSNSAPGTAGAGTAVPGTAPAPSGSAAPGGAGEGNSGNVPLAPAGMQGAGPAGTGGASAGAPSATPGASGAPSAPPGAAGQGAGGSPAVGGAGPGRVGAELCPPGPFGSPFANGAAVPQQPLASVGDNNFFVFEGPVWTGDALYLSEIANGNASQIDRFEPGVGLTRGVFSDTGSNGLALDAAGNLLLAAHDVGGISSVDIASGAITRGAQTRNGARFNSPNDLVVRGDGNVYFTDPDFQAPNGRTQQSTGVYRIASPAATGEISVVDESMNNPNGITLSPDGNTLYVSAAGALREYSLDAAGAATPVGDITNQIGTPDGMTVDCAGNIYAADNGGRAVLVFSPDGELLQTIGQNVFPQGVTNVAFGGPNRTTLFITTFSQGQTGGLYSVELAVPGLPY